MDDLNWFFGWAAIKPRSLHYEPAKDAGSAVGMTAWSGRRWRGIWIRWRLDEGVQFTAFGDEGALRRYNCGVAMETLRPEGLSYRVAWTKLAA